jgi:polygalacturonase
MGTPRRDFLKAALATAALATCRRSWAQQAGNGSAPEEITGWAQLPAILASIVPPQFPARDFVITGFGASPGGVEDCWHALAAAIQDCHQAGGGRVVVPAGNWLSNGPIHLLSNVNLFLEEGANIEFGTDPENYLPVVLVRWAGTRCYNYSPLVYAYQQTNIAITGSGTLYGRGTVWNQWTAKQGPDVTLLQYMALDGVPVEDRIFGPGHYLRPTMFEPYDCQNILVQGVTLRGSPFWTMHPTFCTNVTIQNVTVFPGAESDDGCDPDSCQNVLVTGCNFTTEDDNVSIKAGSLPDAAGLPACENIVIQDCNCLQSSWGGLTLGSNTGGFIRNVFIENCTVSNCLNAHYLKSHANLGGGIENVYIRSNHVLTCHNLLYVAPDAYDEAGIYGPPVFVNIHMQDVTCGHATDCAFVIEGDPRQPIEGVNLGNIAIKATRLVDQVAATDGLVATGITVDGSPVNVGD